MTTGIRAWTGRGSAQISSHAIVGEELGANAANYDLADKPTK
jgi:hypothetical protein